MLSRRPNKQSGVTIAELLVVMIASSILLTTLYVFTSSSINDFMRLQADGLAHNKLSESSSRITKVMRGINQIETAEADSITAYSYFAPHDTYTSKIRYYLNANQDKLLADVTPMTANYPIGSLLTNQMRTVTIIDGFKKVPNKDTFMYYDGELTQLTSPVADKQTIKNITVQLFVKKYKSTNPNYVSTVSSVNLRNRKSNL